MLTQTEDQHPALSHMHRKEEEAELVLTVVVLVSSLPGSSTNPREKPPFTTAPVQSLCGI